MIRFALLKDLTDLESLELSGSLDGVGTDADSAVEVGVVQISALKTPVSTPLDEL